MKSMRNDARHTIRKAMACFTYTSQIQSVIQSAEVRRIRTFVAINFAKVNVARSRTIRSGSENFDFPD